MSRTTIISLSVISALLVLPASAAAQSADELAKQTQNPVASLISVPLQGNWDFGLNGPSAVVLTQAATLTVGLLFNQIWSVSGANDRDDVTSTDLQPFLNYNLGGGLSAGASVEASANWEADEAHTPRLTRIALRRSPHWHSRSSNRTRRPASRALGPDATAFCPIRSSRVGR